MATIPTPPSSSGVILTPPLEEDLSSDEEMTPAAMERNNQNQNQTAQQTLPASSSTSASAAAYIVLPIAAVSTPAPAAAAAASPRSSVLPGSLRAAALRLTPCTPHMCLYPSHRYDTQYTYGSDKIEERRTSFEMLTAEEKSQFTCPTMMNTPETRWNSKDEEAEEAADEEMAAEENEEEGEEGETKQNHNHHHKPYPSTTPMTTRRPQRMKHQSQMSPGGETLPSSSPPAFSPAMLDAASAGRTSVTQHANNNHTSSSSSTTPLPSATAAEDDDTIRPGFVQCSKCAKWRTVPSDIDAASLPSTWLCENNDWDSRYARCHSADEVLEDSSFWTGLPIKFIHTVGQYTFYRRLVRGLRTTPTSANATTNGNNGTPIDDDPDLLFDKFPTIRRKPVNMLLTYKTVIKLGGYDKVTASNQWKTLQSCLRIPDTHDSSFTLKKLYKKYIYDYECKYWVNPRSMQSQNGAGKPGMTRHASRSSSSSGIPSNGTLASNNNPHSNNANPNASSGVGASVGLPLGVRKAKRQRRDANEDGVGVDDEDDLSSRKRRKPILSNSTHNGGVGSLDELVDDEMADYLSGGVGVDDSSSGVVHATGGTGLLHHIRSLVDARFRQLDRQLEDRCNRIETNLTKLLRDGLKEMRETNLYILQQDKKRHTQLQKELDKKQELLARGMNMLLSERLKANLPKLAHIKLKASQKQEAQAAAAATSTPAAPSPSASSSSSIAQHAQSVKPKHSSPGGVPPPGLPPTGLKVVLEPLFPSSSLTGARTSASIGVNVGCNASSNGSSTPIGVPHYDEAKECAPLTFSVTTFVPQRNEQAVEGDDDSDEGMATKKEPIDDTHMSDAYASTHTASVVLDPYAPLLVDDPPSPQSLSWVRTRLSHADAVCFDVDSTVSAEEGIDVLAEHVGQGDAVRAYTSQAMNGSVTFESALRARLELMKPSQAQVEECVRERPPTFTKGFLEFVAWLRSDAIRPGGLPIYLVSGGFRTLIEPLRLALNLPTSHVFANTIEFDEDGEYRGFDASEFTSRSGGKARALSHIAERDGRTCMVMIGDGMTDVEASPPAKLMIGFGGITIRPAVKAKAHYYVTQWKEVQAIIQDK